MKIKEILKDTLKDIKPNEEEIKEINNYSKKFLKKFNSNAKKLKINAEAFIGGSSAKRTVIKKEIYDVDVFVRFIENQGFSIPQIYRNKQKVRDEKKYTDREISELTEKILKSFAEKFIRIHGSRDYFSVRIRKNACIELIPVIKIKNPKDAKNVTDLSYSHVKYINKKIKGKLNDEILLAKAFCYANRCYGAESYISGFSGYALELLICHYKSFLNMIKAIAKSGNDEKIIIDIEKKYKNKNMIMMDVNDSKLKSPVILIDPTFKSRNVAAALSNETFEKFKKACVKFLKNPSKKYFLVEKINFDKIMADAKKKRYECIFLKAITNKQEGDIAGSKLMKFYNHFAEEISKFFEIKRREFEYEGNKSAKYLFICKNRGEILLPGPFTSQTDAIKQFKKAHRKTFFKKGRIFAKEKINFSIKGFILQWKNKNALRINEMSVVNLKIL